MLTNVFLVHEVLFLVLYSSKDTVAAMMTFLLAVLGFTLVRQALYHLSYTSLRPFIAPIILEMGSCFLARLIWTRILPILASHVTGDDRHMPPCPATG
jgi:hypothetical protein